MKILNSVSEKDYGLYVSNYPKLQESFLAFKSGKKIVFSIWALLFGVLWLAYNRLYKATILFFAVVLVMFASGASMGAIGGTTLILCIAVGLFGTRLLTGATAKHVSKIKKLHKDSDVAEKALTGKFKPSKLAVIVALFVYGGITSLADSPSYALVAGSEEAKQAGVSYAVENNTQQVTTPQVQVTLAPAEKTDGFYGEYAQLIAPEGSMYVFVRYTVKNLTEKALNSSLVEVQLLDKEGSVYKDDWGCVAQVNALRNNFNFSAKLEDLNPSVMGQYGACFKVAKAKLNNGWQINLKADKNIILPLR